MAKSTNAKPAGVTRAPRSRKTAIPPETTIMAEPDVAHDSPLPHTQIAARAYQLFLATGAMHGRDLEHWLQAEHELRDRGLVAMS